MVVLTFAGLFGGIGICKKLYTAVGTKQIYVGNGSKKSRGNNKSKDNSRFSFGNDGKEGKRLHAN
jgi:hypothetical protein